MLYTYIYFNATALFNTWIDKLLWPLHRYMLKIERSSYLTYEFIWLSSYAYMIYLASYYFL